MEELSFWVGIVASAAFAITGVLAISERGVDLFGVLVLGIITVPFLTCKSLKYIHIPAATNSSKA